MNMAFLLIGFNPGRINFEQRQTCCAIAFINCHSSEVNESTIQGIVP
jgi:hypothetical protein